MKIRLIGTKAEIQWYLEQVKKMDQVQIDFISDYYANRGSSTIYRLYIDIKDKASE